MISPRNTMEHSGASGCPAPALAPKRGPAPPTLGLVLLTAALLITTLRVLAEPLAGAPDTQPCAAPTPAANSGTLAPRLAAGGGSSARANLQWLPSHGPECIKRGPYKRFCQGPRRAPAPHGEAAVLASKLGLGQRTSAVLLLIGPPEAAWVEAAAAVEAAPKWQWPVVDGQLLRGMGRSKLAAARRAGVTRRRAHYHEGLDIGGPEGSAIAAAQSGIVVYSDNGVRGYGNLVVVVHADGSSAFYAHCRATYVFPGQQVTRGQVIGEVGQTGYARGPHLHFEYRIKGIPTDPTPLFE